MSEKISLDSSAFIQRYITLFGHFWSTWECPIFLRIRFSANDGI